MSEVKNLIDQKAIEKLKEIAEKIKVCMFCTFPSSEPFESRPMSTLKVDDEGNLWFMSPVESNKNEELQNDEHVQLIYSDNPTSTFMSVFGTCEITRDRQKIDELWNPIAQVWFTEGKDDPRVRVIKVSPLNAYYWDNKHNKMIAFMKMMVSLAIKKPMDDGIEGKLNFD
jgi:general stress protein 26